MLKLHSLAVSLLAALLCSGSARAQGLVQLSLEGRLTRAGGGRVEVEIAARGEHGDREVVLGLHLARGTSGSDLAELVASRLERAGFYVLAPRASGKKGEPAHVFVEDAYWVRLRLGGGLSGAITATDSAPSEVRVAAPQAHPAAGRVVVSATALSPHTKKTDQRTFYVDVEAEAHPAQVVNRVHEAALAADWMADRPTTHSWRPVRMVDGSLIEGFSLAVESEGDWRVEVVLPREAR